MTHRTKEVSYAVLGGGLKMKFDFLVGLVATVICLPALSFADGGGSNDCSDIRLDQPSSDRTAGSMQSVQVRDQGTYGICYGETAVELFDAYRFSRAGDSHTDAQSSALAATIDYSITTGADAYAGGSTCAVLNYLSGVGTENDATVSSCIINFETPSLVSGLQEIYERESSQINTEKQQLLSQNLSPQELRSEFTQAKQTIYRGDIPNIQGLLASQGINTQMMPDTNAILSTMDMGLARVAWGLSAYACANSSQAIQISVPTCVDAVPATDESFLATWNSRLSLPGAEPIEVSYCGAVLREGRAYGGVTRTGSSHQCTPTTTTANGTSNHASLIIGRRTNPETGSCQFLIRNSWGTACKISQMPLAPGNDVPKDSRPSLPKATPIPDPSTDLRYAPEWDCDAGNIWVDADSLARSAYRTSWISDGTVSF